MTYAEEYKAFLSSTGFFDLGGFGTVDIEGKDSAEYLKRMSSSLPPAPNKIAHTAFLTGKGHTVALGWLLGISPTHFRMILSPGQAATCREHLEKFHFQEQLTISDKSSEFFWLGLNGRHPFLAEPSEPLSLLNEDVLGTRCLVWRDDLREWLTWVGCTKTQAKDLKIQIKAHGIPALGGELFDFLRIRSGLPQMGKEITGNEIILEAGFEAPVARNKGCYPGQEVVERIYTYGSVNRKLFPVRIEATAEGALKLPTEFSSNGAVAGILISAAKDPSEPGESAGFAYVLKSFWGTEAFEAPGLKVYAAN